MDPRADDGTALRNRAQRGGDELARRREDDCRVDLLGRSARAGPLSAERARERLRVRVVLAGDGEHAPPLEARDLGHDVRGGAEPVEAEPFRATGETQRSVADQAGAKKRRRLEVAEAGRQRQAEALVGDRPLGVPAVAVVAGEARTVTEVLAAAQAVAALAARPAEPGNTEAPSVLGLADDLVAGDERQLRLRQLAVHDEQVGAADAARADAEQQLPRRGFGPRELSRDERRARRFEHHRTRCAQRSILTTIFAPGLPDA